MILSNSKILVTGGAGFLGSQIVAQLKKEGCKKIYVPRSKDYDLRKISACKKVVRDIDIVIHAAGNVGGIGLNMRRPAELFFDNLIMGVNLMEEARKANVKKFITIGTVCSYPKYTKVPFREEDLWDGYPEETNAPYGLAKKMLLVQGQSYRTQFNFNAIYLLPVNLYGPGDNFEPNTSHVIPALITKFHQAKSNGWPEVVVWGTGKASREFLFVTDAARAVVLATKNYDKPEPVNIGSSFEIKIRDLALLIKDIVGYQGRIVWDRTKPDGQPRRKLDTTKAWKEFKFKSQVPFELGLKKVYRWYLESAPKV